VRLLLDTHVVVWWQLGSRNLKLPVRRRIEAADHVFVSVASAWEATIKAALGKLRIPASLAQAAEDSHFEELPILFRHVAVLAELPPHHRDPFDRILVAQASAEGLTIVTHDRRLEPYAVPIVWT
jgi:PIN domain nuclease of toxin-antitoxin system